MTPPPDDVVDSESLSSKAFLSHHKFKTVHVVAYTIAAVIARQYSGWQIGLSPGFGAFMIGQVLTAFGCICHYLCLMEIWSAVPFSGGSYGLSRATLGFHLGFLDGCLEALVYIGHAALSATGMGTRICAIFEVPLVQGNIFALCSFALALALCVQNDVRLLRRSFMVLAVIGLIILLIYCLGMMKYVNFQENASLHRVEPASSVDNWFQGGWSGWIAILPWTLQPYAGIRSFTLLTAMTENPKVTLPRAVVITFAIIIAINIMVVFVFVSQPGGIEHTAARLIPPMKVGWSLIFGTEDNKLLTTRLTAILQLPVTFSRMYAYLVPASIMMHSMGRSNLMPSIMMINHSKDATRAAVWCAAFGMGLVVVLYYYPVIELFNLTVMATMITDCTFLYGYILLKTTYSTVPREFVSPFGMVGAVYAFCMYVLIFISAAFYQGDYFALKFFAGFLGILSIYYHFFARSTQTLNEEEDHVFFKIHVRNFNIAKKNTAKKKVQNFSVLQWKQKHSRRIAAANYEVAEGNEDNGMVDAAVTVDMNQSTSHGKEGFTQATRPDPLTEDTGLSSGSPTAVQSLPPIALDSSSAILAAGKVGGGSVDKEENVQPQQSGGVEAEAVAPNNRIVLIPNIQNFGFVAVLR